MQLQMMYAAGHRVAMATKQGYAVVDIHQGVALATECLMVSTQIVENSQPADPEDFITSFSFGWEYMNMKGTYATMHVPFQSIKTSIEPSFHKAGIAQTLI